jgi:hypothetical protein
LSSTKGFHYVELLTCLQMTQDAKKLPCSDEVAGALG